jgi:hypothetical protein
MPKQHEGGLNVAHITIEYIIMIPVLILQVVAFPIVANSLMNIWVDSRRTLALKDVASNLGSVIQQLYFSVNHPTVPVNTMIEDSPGLPPLIENHHYEGRATLRTILQPAQNSSKVLELTLKLATIGTTATATVILGSNALWQESTFISNSTSARVSAQKFPNKTIGLGFGG